VIVIRWLTLMLADIDGLHVINPRARARRWATG
jgi:hypothetical protein